MLPQIDTLPGTQPGTAIDDRDAQSCLRQNGSHVGRHIVWTFVIMDELRVAIRYQPAHEGLEINPYSGVSIFAQHQGGTGMVDEDMTKPGIKSRLADDRLDFSRDISRTPSPGHYLNLLLKHQDALCKQKDILPLTGIQGTPRIIYP
jgi:hypothetical protein